MALWTPANLSVLPKLVLDASSATWSGSNFVSQSNVAYGLGGTLVPNSGTVTKGTQLNGLDVFHTTGQSIKLPSVTTSDDIIIYAVSKVAASTGGALISHEWPTGGSNLGWVSYPRQSSGTGVGITWNNNDALVFGGGFGPNPGFGSGASLSGPLLGDSAWHHTTISAGNTNYLRTDGGSVTPVGNHTATNATVTSQDIIIFSDAGNETFSSADFAVVLLLNSSTPLSDVLGLDGYYYWRYLDTPNVITHPFRWAPPQLVSGAPAALTPWLRAAGTFAHGTTTCTPGMPSGFAAGDLLVCVIETANQGPTLGPSGYTAATNSPQGTGTAGGAAATRLDVYYKISTGSETSPAIAVVGDHIDAQIFAFANVDPTTPINITAGAVAASASTSVSMPTATTTVADALIMNIVANATDTATSQTSGFTNAGLVLVGLAADNNTTDGNGGGFGVSLGLKAAAGATGATTATLATSSVQALFTLAIAPPLAFVALSSTGRMMLRTRGALLGTTALSSRATGQQKSMPSLRGFLAMSARSKAQATASASMTRVAVLTARVTSMAKVAAGISGVTGLSTRMQAQLKSSGVLAGVVAFSTRIQGAMMSQGGLRAFLALSSRVIMAAKSSADPSGSAALTTKVKGQAQVHGDLSGSAALASRAQGQANASGALTGMTALSTRIIGMAKASGGLTGSSQLAALSSRIAAMFRLRPRLAAFVPAPPERTVSPVDCSRTVAPEDCSRTVAPIDLSRIVSPDDLG